jgi:hypothetical protein
MVTSAKTGSQSDPKAGSIWWNRDYWAHITEYLDTQDDWQGIGVARHKQQTSALTPFSS